MKLKTRLLITFLAIFALPLVLTAAAFSMIGSMIVKEVQNTYSMESIDSAALMNASEEYDAAIKT